MAKEGILLESGTNEVELLEFLLDGQSLGVNVLKIQAIEQFDPARITRIQLADPAVVGTLLFRDHCVTMVDLARHLRETRSVPAATPAEHQGGVVDGIAELVEESVESAESAPARGAGADAGNKLVLIMEFNDRMTAFLVDGVNRIHRVSWGDISPMSPYLNRAGNKFTGSIQIDGREILIVDMEKIVTEVLPAERLAGSVIADPTHPHFHRRGELTILLAEDSSVIRDRVEEELAKANYTRVISFPNGQACFDRITEMQEAALGEDRPLNESLAAVITDIEMPAMDGLTLCRNIKELLMIKDVPVIMFSSLINDQIATKCNDVGAEAYISKPQFMSLVDLLDKHCLDNRIWRD